MSKSVCVGVWYVAEGRGDVEGGHGWIRTLPPARLQLVDAETARKQLVEAFEENKGSRLAIVLATDIFYSLRRENSEPRSRARTHDQGRQGPTCSALSPSLPGLPLAIVLATDIFHT